MGQKSRSYFPSKKIIILRKRHFPALKISGKKLLFFTDFTFFHWFLKMLLELWKPKFLSFDCSMGCNSMNTFTMDQIWLSFGSSLAHIWLSIFEENYMSEEKKWLFCTHLKLKHSGTKVGAFLSSAVPRPKNSPYFCTLLHQFKISEKKSNFFFPLNK